MFKRSGLFRKFRSQVEAEVSEANGIRSLYLGSPTVQSSMRIQDPYALILDYTKAMMSFLLFQDSVDSVSCVGLGAGSLLKFIWKNMPNTQITAIEKRADVINIARNYFFLPEDDSRLTVIHEDGLVWVDKDSESDVILLDAFDGSGTPSGFFEESFVQKTRSRLTGNGIFIQNLWTNDPLFHKRISLVEDYFDRVILAPTPKGRRPPRRGSPSPTSR